MDNIQTPDYKKISPDILKLYTPYMGKSIAGNITLSDHIFSYHFHQEIIFNTYQIINQPIIIEILTHQNEYLFFECPSAFINLILYHLITPLSLNDLHEEMIINSLEIICASYIEVIEKKYGFTIHFCTKKPDISLDNRSKTQFILTHQETKTPYPISIYGKENNVKDFLDKIFQFATENITLNAPLSCVILSTIKQFPTSKINQLKRGGVMVGQRHLLNNQFY